MGILIGVLMVCINYKDGATECDVRVKDRVVNMAPKSCEMYLRRNAERIKSSAWSTETKEFPILRVTITAACYGPKFGATVVRNIPYALKDMGAEFTITHY